jgi:RNA polymerase sigma-70 factor (ECF subfamily)
MNSSQDLIARARSGEHEAFRLIFERYAKPILGFIYEMVGERDLAEELTQETFVRAFNHLGKLRDDSKFATWLFGISKNVARESLRSRVREIPCDNEANSALENRIELSSPSDQLFGKELNTAVRRALSALDHDRRLVFVLKVYQQWRYDEIAEITGFSVAKVKTDLHRARMELRRRLQPFRETLR